LPSAPNPSSPVDADHPTSYPTLAVYSLELASVLANSVLSVWVRVLDTVFESRVREPDALVAVNRTSSWRSTAPTAIPGLGTSAIRGFRLPRTISWLSSNWSPSVSGSTGDEWKKLNSTLSSRVSPSVSWLAASEKISLNSA
jgi:hypothetical protein